MAGHAMRLSGFPNTLHDCVRLSEDDHREILSRMKNVTKFCSLPHLMFSIRCGFPFKPIIAHGV